MSGQDSYDFDVAVVGAGPAGSVAAHQLAGAGHDVVLIERGSEPGSKNLSGGVLYGRALEAVFPDYLDDAPVERRITRNVVTFLNRGSRVAIDYSDDRLADPTNAVTVLRAKLDPWLAGRAEEAGAMLMPGVRVDAPLLDGSSRVIGVKAGEDELRTRVVVAADGVNSFLARAAGFRPAPEPHQLAVGVKAVVDLPAATIEERFGVAPGLGAAHAIVGDCTLGIGGGGFLYTNRESLSLGVVLRLDDLVKRGLESTEVFEHFLAHPGVAPFLEGGEVSEYGCHLVAEGGQAMMGRLAVDGMVLVGDAAGLTINSGLTVRGMDLAVGSGSVAATVVHDALEAGDTSLAALGRYEQALRDSWVGQDMATYAKAPAFLEEPRMYDGYGTLLADVLHGVFDLDTRPRRRLWRTALDTVRHSPLRTRDLVSDVWKGVRSL
ncbi:FAD-dependent oxidoreductase [Actinotalea sp. M2MS4P-6]|uniref:FAD-dependent oxidoreductase n=1 Tax=Actinotalea sp. M2MS4P-6 TaxID=2983762 RepID=UPI0021E4FABD|nr:FAD-dependent oxidoreductase [Actinotalea sp. M2MS4P-6]MCV2394759.1 FAD-dependent oxidoreductase [Actinotalea sp. M2MS4P-6]